MSSMRFASLPSSLNKPPVFRRAALSLALCSAAVFGLAGLAQAQGGPDAGQARADHAGHGGRAAGPMAGPMYGLPHGRMLDHLLDDVKATPEQREQIHKITQAAQADMQANHEAARATQDQMMQAFVATPPDAKAAEAARQQMLARHDAATKRGVQVMLDVAKVLTPEQRKQMADTMKRHADQMGQHMGGHMDGRRMDGRMGGQAGNPPPVNASAPALAPRR